MDSNLAYATIIYLALFRLAIISVGALSIYLGYKLFVRGIFAPEGGEGAGLEAEFGGTRFSLKNAAPGTFFALFGVIVISIMIVNSPPEMNYSKVDSAEKTDLSTPDPTENLQVTETFALRGVGTGENRTKLANSLNNHAWDLTEAGQALMFARLALEMAPDSGAIIDTLAEMLYRTEEFAEALEFKERAAKLDPKFSVDIDKFRLATES